MLRIGHRGAAGYEPENTLRSIEKAIELGVDMVEFDVRLCKTGEVVVMHDPRLRRTTNGRGLVRRTSLAKLKKLDAGKGEHIPLFEEALERINRKVKVYVELKGQGTARPTAKMIRSHMERGWRSEDFLVASFSLDRMRAFGKLLPSVPRALIMNRIPRYFVSRAIRDKLSTVVISKKILTKNIVDRAHAAGLTVYSYTPNEPEEISRIKNMGVDGIISNYPDRI